MTKKLPKDSGSLKPCQYIWKSSPQDAKRFYLSSLVFSHGERTAGEAVRILRKGGVLVMVGYGKTGMVNFPMRLALDKEIRIETVFRYRHSYPTAIDAVAAGTVKLKGIVTTIFAFGDIQNPMDLSVRDKANIVKAVVKIP